MKKLLFALIAGTAILFGCSEDETESQTFYELGQYEIGPQDDQFYSFLLEGGQEYTLSLDFTDYSYFGASSDLVGSWHQVLIDWGTGNTIAIDCSLRATIGPKVKCPKSSFCFTPTEDIEFRVRVYDNNYSDNSGIAVIALDKGSIGFTDGNYEDLYSPENEDSQKILLEAGKETKVSLDFSHHSFDLYGGEPKGWRHIYERNYFNGSAQFLLEIGTIDEPLVYVPKTSITYIADETTTIEYKVPVYNNTINNGEVKFNY